ASCREFIEDLLGQSTRQTTTPGAGADLWYMVYRDDEGTVHTVKGTTDNIRKAYREGLLGDASNIRAARTKQGPFQALHSYPQFRDLVLDPEAMVARASTDPPAPTPPPSSLNEADSAIVTYDATAAVAVQPLSKWGQPSGRFRSPASTRNMRPSSTPIVPRSGPNLLVWGTILFVAIAIGVVSVLLLR